MRLRIVCDDVIAYGILKCELTGYVFTNVTFFITGSMERITSGQRLESGGHFLMGHDV